MVRELDQPPETLDDPEATEMIRVWLAHQDLHVSLLLGMWEDAANPEVDERDAWGTLLADVVFHIANGLGQSHGWSAQETQARISKAFRDRLASQDAGVTGAYVED